MVLMKSFALFAALALVPVLGGTTDSGTESDRPATSTARVSGVAAADGSTVFTTEQTQLTVLPSTEPQPSHEKMSAMAATITCSLNVHHVHASHHVSGTINGTSTISCNGNAGSLTLHYSLIRVSPNPLQWGAGSKSNQGLNSIANNRAVPCSEGPGDFRGWAQGVISPPPGYTLTGPASDKKYGTILPVACGDVGRSTRSDDTVSQTTTVTFARSDLSQ